MNVILILLVSIGAYIAYEAIQYSRLEKEKNERAYKQDSLRVNQKRKDTECCSKVSKSKTQNKSKSNSTKKKSAKSKSK